MKLANFTFIGFTASVFLAGFSSIEAAGNAGKPPLSYEQRLAKQLAAIDTALGNDAVTADVLTDAERANLVKKRNEFAAAIEAAKKDGVSVDEWRGLVADYKDTAKTLNHARFKRANLENRIEAQRKVIDRAKELGQLTEDEHKAALARLNKIEADLKKDKSLSIDDKLAFNKRLGALGLFVKDNRKDQEGTAALIEVNRKGDNVDERQAEQSRRIGACVASGRLSPIEIDYLKALEANTRKSESSALVDGVLSAAEKADLKQQLDANNLTIAKACKDKKSIVAATKALPEREPASVPVNEFHTPTGNPGEQTVKGVQ